MRIAIVGAGMSGICMGVKLRQAGIDTFTIFEKAADVGGTWRDNAYPGLTCDVPSPFYSYRFAPNPEWTQRFSTGPELHAYFRGVAERHGVLPHVRFGCEVTEVRRVQDEWELTTADGARHRAGVVVAATGVLHRPVVPALPGAETFAGAAFHSARWDPGVRLDGARIGVIGTGSTGVQIVTALAGRAAKVVHFQRTPQWILAWPNFTYPGWLKTILRRSARARRLFYGYHERTFRLLSNAVLRPGWQRRLVQSLSRANLRTVRDRALRERLRPDYEPMCKRLIVSAGYYRAVQRPTVELVSAAVVGVEPGGVVAGDGSRHALDVIVYATGFDAQAFLRPIEVVGEDGLTLTRAWSDGPKAHRTVMLPGFPNLFLLMGPNSPIGNTSLVPIAEAQADYALRWIKRIRAGEVTRVEPTAEATAAFNEEIRDNMGDTVWVTGCDSWYLGPDGSPTLWPFSLQAFEEMLAEVDESEYLLGAGPRARAHAAV